MHKLGIILVGVGFLALAAFFWLSRPAPPSYTLRLATGKLTKPPNRMTRYFEERGPHHGVRFQLEDVEGSEDSLKRLKDGSLDVAIVKAGLKLPADTSIREMTALDVEVLHLLIKKEWADAARKNLGVVLRGKKININTAATGTHHWSLDLLRFIGLRPVDAQGKGSFQASTLDNAALLRAMGDIERGTGAEARKLRETLPDAILLGAPVPSNIARRLIAVGDYRLVPLTFGPAYIVERKAEAPEGEVLDHATVIENVTIPAYLYGIDPPVPPEPCPSIGFRRLLVVRDTVPVEAVLRVLRMVYDSSQEGGLDPIDLDKLRPQYELHPAVAVYQDERAKVLQTALIKWGEKAASVASGVVGACLAIFGYLNYRRSRRLGRFFQLLRVIDRTARGEHLDPVAPLEPAARLVYLEAKLADIRNEVVEEFATAGYRGEGLINNLLCTIADTRASLPHLLGCKSPPASDETEKG